MIKEALEFLSDRFSKSEEARIINPPGDGRTVLIDQGGKLIERTVAPAVRQHHVKSVDDLIEAAEKWGDAPAIWLNGDNITLVINDADRRDRVTLSLVKSHPFRKLCDLLKSPKLDQSELIRVLRVDLQGTINRAALLTAVRSIKFRTSESGGATINQGNESLGRTIEAEVTGAGDIPESVVVSCPVFSNPGEREKTHTVGCDLEIVPSEKKFLFRPIPDEIERVTDAALADIRDRLLVGVSGAAVFYGSP